MLTSCQEQLVLYEYRLLRLNEIRILDLLSSPHQPLRCRLRAVPFEDGQAADTRRSHDTVDNVDDLPVQSKPSDDTCPSQQPVLTMSPEPSYTALSYVWGARAKPFSMEVVDEDGDSLGYIPLTANLHHALQDLRDSPAPPIAVKTFWIDQICINQADHVEKNYQVRRMKQIYERAAQVITYLG
ncbi:heterokaryon incompatibility protein-domain-containing protein, partial [Coniella lustricola]